MHLNAAIHGGVFRIDKTQPEKTNLSTKIRGNIRGIRSIFIYCARTIFIVLYASVVFRHRRVSKYDTYLQHLQRLST